MRIVLVIVSVIGFAAVIGAIVVGVMSFDGVVTENPYEKGIRWDSMRAERKGSGIEVDLLTEDMSVGKGRMEVMVTGRDGKPYEGLVNLRISRPETESLDRSYKAEQESKGIYAADVEFPRHGYWEVTVEVSWLGNRIGFTEKLHVRRNEGD
jgi:nitrogen fixation protein FixH